MSTRPYNPRGNVVEALDETAPREEHRTSDVPSSAGFSMRRIQPKVWDYVAIGFILAVAVYSRWEWILAYFHHR